MEVGAVKHQLNNEIINLKKRLNQAKVQLIHKLTRKAKTLKSKKITPEKIQEKVQRKADAAVAEVLILKKVEPKELIRFAISHKGKLEDYINKPTVDNEKVYAKILLHKAIHEKYKSLRELFSNMPLDQLLMTRKERLKLKKTKKEEQHNKKGKKSTKKLTAHEKQHISEGKFSDSNDEEKQENIDDSNDESKESQLGCAQESDNALEEENFILDPKKSNGNDSDVSILLEETQQNVITNANKICIKNSPAKKIIKDSLESPNQQMKLTITEPINKIVLEQKKNKHSKSKLKVKKPSKKSRKQDIELAEQNTLVQAKVVDSFFMTETGDHYMTLAEPRAPDEVKEEHYRGNRKMRRAEKFGKPIKPYMKMKSNDTRNFKNSKYEKQHYNHKNNDLCSESSTSSYNRKDSSNNSFPKESFDGIRNNEIASNRKSDEKVEKLHPSWEAKKQKSGIVQFQGKKVSFS